MSLAYPRKMSRICNEVISILKVIFPEALIKTEEFVKYNNQRLFLDIFLPQFGLVVEVHGRQHDEFIRHFHGDAAGFKSYRRRDSLKEEWVAEKGYTLIIIRESDLPLTPDRLLEILDGQ